MAGKNDDRSANRLEVDGATMLQPRLAARQAIADKDVLDDPTDFVLAEEVEATPPPVKFKERFAGLVDLCKQVVILAEPAAPRIQRFEIHDQVGPIELARIEIGEQCCRQSAAKQAAEIA